jgi:chitin disaccharide deacetylase
VQHHEPVRTVLQRAARRLGVPLRGLHDRVRFRGDFYGQGPRGEPFTDGVTLRRLIEIIRAIGDGWTELGCHPGIGVDTVVTTYACERELEVTALCAPSARATTSRR